MSSTSISPPWIFLYLAVMDGEHNTPQPDDVLSRQQPASSTESAQPVDQSEPRRTKRRRIPASDPASDDTQQQVHATLVSISVIVITEVFFYSLSSTLKRKKNTCIHTLEYRANKPEKKEARKTSHGRVSICFDILFNSSHLLKFEIHINSRRCLGWLYGGVG